ncbi:MFS transporter [Breoghania sp. L-A4]|uniref:MFS transporter n=1 Tax=Breoghania sp. L-A4 TaxID=2304600 RepID=UPI001968A1FD|nr:MFS transporter [Breoghania sp. L-A4]
MEHAADRGYRWVVLGISSVILAVTMGQLVNGLSVYFVPIGASEGWNRGDIALINTCGLLGLGIGSLVMGYMAERFGIRRVVLFGIIATGLATIAASSARELWQFYALYFLAGALGGAPFRRR